MNTQLEIHPRTITYNLEPIAPGTDACEALTSYGARLANEHSLSIMKILFQIYKSIGTQIPPKQLRLRAALDTGTSTHHQLNGCQPSSQEAVDLFQHATGRTDLKFLTLLPWKDLFRREVMMRRHLAFCPYCFAEQRENVGKSYIPLLWCIRAVQTCLVHRIYLQTSCFHCGYWLPIISCRTRPGFCNRCGNFLGSGIPDIDHLGKYGLRDWTTYEYSQIIENNSSSVKTKKLVLKDLRDVEYFY